jgi:hypothetical protein
MEETDMSTKHAHARQQAQAVGTLEHTVVMARMIAQGLDPMCAQLRASETVCARPRGIPHNGQRTDATMYDDSDFVAQVYRASDSELPGVAAEYNLRARRLGPGERGHRVRDGETGQHMWVGTTQCAGSPSKRGRDRAQQRTRQHADDHAHHMDHIRRLGKRLVHLWDAYHKLGSNRKRRKMKPVVVACAHELLEAYSTR